MKAVKIENMPELPYAVEEALNRLRVNITFLGTDVRKIMVISTMPDEGKSFVAIQLWRQLADTGISSVLLDADMRKSVMADKYKLTLENEGSLKGTSHYLSGSYPLEDAIYHTQFEKGDILPNTDNVVNPSRLLESSRFAQMLDQMAEKYRYVLVDSAPLDLVSDGERIGSLCDGALLVVRAGTTPKGIVKKSVQQLERAGCPLLGIILNRVENYTGGYYNKRYGSRYYGKRYYGYGKRYYGYGKQYYGYGNEYYKKSKS